MCYTGQCRLENYMGDCIIANDERKFLQESFGFSCLIPHALEEEDLPFDEAYRALWDYRESREVAKKLMEK